MKYNKRNNFWNILYYLSSVLNMKDKNKLLLSNELLILLKKNTGKKFFNLL